MPFVEQLFDEPLQRLSAVESWLLGNEDSTARRGVLLIPRILGCDEWEAIAAPRQAAAWSAASEDTRDRGAPLRPVGEPLDVLREGIDYHAPDPNRPQEARPKRPPQPSITR